ncbi:MAG: GNAT family N-acetyltransferase [Oscillatoriales cyanobacterium RM2_1_1]|nr:GNAT family N-acetyltransferase [Oscillatoriales cyanobacterium SM2_3_0]NJO47184.1 GNAT family N-acetyltransferase [Oscillatoriales cyanobacterium RM2_1_1]
MVSSTQDYRHILFRDGQSSVDLDQLQELFKIAAFWARERRREDLETAIANSDPVVTIWDGEQMIGFSRGTSDGIYRATIWDVVIHPDYQGGGLGRKLVQTVLSHPKMCRVERVYLMTTHQQKFYERIGFQYNSTTTMVLYNQPFDSEFSSLSSVSSEVH